MGERMRVFLERVQMSLRQKRSRIVLLVVLIVVVLVALLSVTLGMMSQEEDLEPVPGAPTNLVAEATSASRVDLSWQDNSDNESGFRIERLTGTGGSYDPVGEVGADVFFYSDLGLIGDTPYYYRVRAYGKGGNSPYSNIAAAKTPVLTPPNAPTNLGAEAMASGWIDLGWWDNSDIEAGFKVMRRAKDGIFRQIANVEANVNQYSDIGLTESTEYYYQVLAYNDAGASGLSNEAGAMTLDPTYHIWGGNARGSSHVTSVTTVMMKNAYDTWRPGNIHMAPAGTYFAVVPVTITGRASPVRVERQSFILRNAVTHDEFGMFAYPGGVLGKPFADQNVRAGKTASGVILFLVPKSQPIDELEVVYYLDGSIHIWPAPEQPEA